jgi:hypothetical protein
MCRPFWFKVAYCTTCDLPTARDQSNEVAVVHATLQNYFHVHPLSRFIRVSA